MYTPFEITVCISLSSEHLKNPFSHIACLLPRCLQEPPVLYIPDFFPWPMLWPAGAASYRYPDPHSFYPPASCYLCLRLTANIPSAAVAIMHKPVTIYMTALFPILPAIKILVGPSAPPIMLTAVLFSHKHMMLAAIPATLISDSIINPVLSPFSLVCPFLLLFVGRKTNF